MKNIMILLITSLIPTTIWANTAWSCQNSINEVRCNKNSCHSSAPMASQFDVRINNNQNISVCSQGKCWNGQAKKSKENKELYEIKQFGWTAQHEPNADYLLGVNHSDQSLYLQGNGKKMPLQCKLA